MATTIERAMEHHRAGRMPEAERLYLEVLAGNPRDSGAAFLLGVIALESGRLEAAAELFARAALLAPTHAGYHANLGEARRRLRQFDAALAAFQRAIALNPDLLAAVYNLGLLFQDTGEFRKAIATYRRALELAPGLPDIHNNLGNALMSAGRIGEAVVSFRRALAIAPDYVNAHNNLGNALVRCGLVEEGLASYRRAVDLKPDEHCFRSNFVFNLHFHPRYDARATLREARAWHDQHASQLGEGAASHDNDPDPNRRLRVGYVSPNFREHCQAFFLAPLLAHHDHRAFHLSCYSDASCPDAVTERLAAFADHWQPIVGLDDVALASRIREDRIDVLVDLTMHMDGNRLLAFARKPAPVQVCWLAYPGTTGLATMDYRVTDPFLDPPGSDLTVYSEKPLHLPDSFWCYNPLTGDPEVGPLPARRNGHVRFGCLNNFAKVNEAVLALWARVLTQVADSRLVFLAPESEGRARALSAFEALGIDRARVDANEYAPRPDYLASYNDIDVCLDTFPYNGHTTSLDAFWMGVPVVTLVGTTVVGRAGACYAANLGLHELIAKSPEEYVKIASDLCSNLDRLGQLRAGLRARMQASPLMDGPRFARNLEAAYRLAWRHWCSRRDV
jgi:predicted O-linked N-acetylglucosamine transferase (SPINDLY family)